jgi:hypothetical protein
MWWRSEEKSNFRKILKIVIYNLISYLFLKRYDWVFLVKFLLERGVNERYYYLVFHLNQLMWLQFCFLTTF